MTLRASRTDVRGGESSEVRLPMAVAAGTGRSETPTWWGLGGAAADYSPARIVHDGSSSDSAIAVETFMNNAGWLQQFGEPAQEQDAQSGGK